MNGERALRCETQDADDAQEQRQLLRPYQTEAAAAVIGAFRAGTRRVLVQMATGLGKTVLFGHLTHGLVAAGGRVLILAHRDELLTQARDKLLAVDPGADIGIVRAERDEVGHAITIASVQTVVRPERLARLGAFDLVIVDEAHHATAASYRAILTDLGAFDADRTTCVLGVTATPGRADGVGLGAVFEAIVFEMDILAGIEGGWLADLRAVSVQLAASFDDVSSRAGDLVPGQLGAALLAADAPAAVVQAYVTLASERRAITFAPTVALAAALVEAFGAASIPAALVSGATPHEERRSIYAALAEGSIRVVANAMVLTEGFDCPPVDCIIIARPTKSAGLYTQMIGRGTRRHPGKPDCLVLDVVGQAGRHSLVTVPTLFGLAPLLLDGRTVRGAVAQQQADRAAEAAAQEEARLRRLVAREVDLFGRTRPTFGGDWERLALRCYGLAVPGAGWVVVQPDEHGYRVTVEQPERASAVLGVELGISEAQRLAVETARRLRAARPPRRIFSWRGEPATTAQTEALERYGVSPSPGLTRGQAFDLLGEASRRRRLA